MIELQSACACRDLNIPTIVLLSQTADRCRGERSHLDIGAEREECCSEMIREIKRGGKENLIRLEKRPEGRGERGGGYKFQGEWNQINGWARTA
ncbi:hypothetical protein EVAR_4655_1 [Eumeta japonica]|uniref:Uncharacterized protein n=1 Tax=Eumeta variegata TaxID=151549 RepID=A0A4C1Y917_EUMVA|nr:hypothetical protein EVAR_4655_1 [Eumeta japonica]